MEKEFLKQEFILNIMNSEVKTQLYPNVRRKDIPKPEHHAVKTQVTVC